MTSSTCAKLTGVLHYYYTNQTGIAMYNSTTNKTNTNNNQIHLNNRYRPRAIGIGYGKSSGYASSRLYSPAGQINLVRVR
jgi:hypothetical protein